VKKSRQLEMAFRVARFFLLQLTKTGENVPNDHRLHIPQCHKIYQGAVTYSSFIYSEALENLPKLDFLVWKYIYHLATLMELPLTHFHAGLPDFSWPKRTKTGKYNKQPQTVPKDNKFYQMAIKYCKWSYNIPTFTFQRPSKIYSNLEFLV
jgi:hypothetical protein